MQYHRQLNRFVVMRFLIPAALLVSIAVILSACAGGGAASPTAAPPAGVAATPAKIAPPGTPGAPAKEVAGGNPQAGQQAIDKYGCGQCHTIPGIPGANGSVGPSLAGFAERPQIAHTVPNTPDNLVKWIQNPQSVKPGTSMPNLNVSESDAKNIAAYLYTLK